MPINVDLPLRKHQKEVLRSLGRFNVLSAHRRFGKTVLAVIILIVKCLECKHKRPVVHYYSPSYGQSKKVAWEYAKEYTRPMDPIINESELKITLPTSGVIQLGSADNPDSSRGIYSDYAVLDEPAQMPQRMWSEILRPALSDRLGGALMIGTPAGRHGLFYDSYQDAAEQDDWWRGRYKASETGIILPEELKSARRTMTQAEYDQEYECSWDAAIRGAYYGETMNNLEAAGAILHLPHDPQRQVYCGFDLGVSDATAIWYFQMRGTAPDFIDYEEITNSGLPDIITHMKRKPYNYGRMIFPFDVGVQSLSTGQTRRKTLQGLGVDVITAPKLPLIDGIDTTRSFLQMARFDHTKCAAGIEALRQYRSDWDDKKGVLRLRPVHDFSSHGADAMRYVAVTDLSRLDNTWGEALVYA